MVNSAYLSLTGGLNVKNALPVTLRRHAAVAGRSGSRFALVLTPALIAGTAGWELASAQPLTRITCRGEFGTGSGMAGSYVGEHCLLAADTDEEQTVQRACEQSTQCVVVGLGVRQSDKWVLRKVVSAGKPGSEAAKAGGPEDPYEAVRRHNRESYEAERQERARLNALGSSASDVMRRSREIQAEQQRAQEAAMAEGAKPGNVMLAIYRNYLVTRQCFESRVGFQAVYLTPAQVEEAKTQVKGIEAGILKRRPDLDTDERWAAANQLETSTNKDISELGFTGRGAVKERIYTEQGRQFCAAAAGLLRDAYALVNPESQTVKKDF